MKDTFKPRAAAAAAAILLASLGAAFVAPPAFAHNTVFPHHHDANELLQRFDIVGSPVGGREITFRVHGMERGEATVTVPGVLNDFKLTEVQPGLYEGRYVLTPRDNPAVISAATATIRVWGTIVHARVGGAGLPGNQPGFETPQQAAAAAAPYRRDNGRDDSRRDNGRDDSRNTRNQRDSRSPEIGAVTPANGDRVSERGRTRVAVAFTDQGTGIDTGAVRLRVDGRDVTGASRVDGNGIEYRDDLAPGRHAAEVTVRDRAGNITRRSWTFDVVDQGRGYGYNGDQGYGRNDGRRW